MRKTRAGAQTALEGIEVVRSRRKTLALEVKAPARVIVRAPMRTLRVCKPARRRVLRPSSKRAC